MAGLVGEVVAGRGGSVWVEGEPGVGKSVVVGAGLAQAVDLGCVVFRAVGEPLGQQRPLGVLLECLASSPVGGDPVLEEVAGRSGRGGGVPVMVDGVAGAAHRLVELVESVCVRSPTVLVVDDMQWADELSLLVWQRLHEVALQAPLLLVAVCRPVPVRAEVGRLRDGLVAGGARVVGVGPLSGEEVVELVERLVGAVPGPRLRELVGQAGGNPFYVRELVDALARTGGVRAEAGVGELVAGAGAGAGAGVRVPVSLAAAIGHRLGFLSERALAVLRVAAVLGVEFSVADVSVVTGRPAAGLLPEVAEAVRSGVLVESGDRLAFRHGLIRQVLYEGVPVALRSAAHRQAAQAFARVGLPVVRVAGQLLATARVDAGGLADEWVVGWLADCATVLAYQAPSVAVELLGRVRQAADIDASRRERLDAALARALHVLARDEEVIELARPQLAGISDPQVAGEMAWLLSYALSRGGHHEEAIEVASAALGRPDLPAAWTARLRARYALDLRWGGASAVAQGQAVARQAEADGTRAGDRLAIVYALHVQSLLLDETLSGQRRALALMDRALRVAGDHLETIDLRLLLLGNRAASLDALDRTVEADRSRREALAQAERYGTARRLAVARLDVATSDFHRGRWDDALAELDAVDALGSDPARRVEWHGLGAIIALHRDEPTELARHLSAAGEVSAENRKQFHWARVLLLPARALAAERDGRPALALAQLAAAVVPDRPDAPDAMELGADRWLWLPDVVRLAVSVQEPATAHRAVATAQALADSAPSRSSRAIAAHCQALLAADPAGVLAAASGYTERDLPLFAAQALENAAVLYAASGEAPAARAAYAQALDIYTDLNAAWSIRRADGRLRRFGIRRSRRGPRRPATGWQALSPIERQIAGLVAAGRSNPDIAGELFLSAHTVRAYVSRILAKLNARSRVDIAREAERQHQTALTTQDG